MFKHTGIVRRMDDIGRIIIPKEIRRKYRIREGDPIEIGEGEKSIILQKYSVFELFSETSEKLLQSFSKVTDMPVILCDTVRVLDAVRTSREIADKELSMELSDCIREKIASCSGLKIAYESDLKVGAIEWVVVNSCVEGALIIPVSGKEITDSHRDCLKVCASALAAIAE